MNRDNRHVIEVKDQRQNFRVISTIVRCPRQHSGWQSIRYQSQRFQLFGGIRNNEFIDIANPLKPREVSK